MEVGRWELEDLKYLKKTKVMRHKNIYKIIVGLVFLLPLVSFGQDVNQNWVKQTVYKEERTTTFTTQPTAAQAQVNVTYLDGLGRPVMQIANKQSNTGKDIVVPIEYDGFGRTTKQYMPYVAANADMSYTDYSTVDINTIVAPSYPQFGSQNFYSETLYEASPLNRVLKQAAPGTTDNWAMGSGHEIKYAYQANTDADLVKKFSVGNSGQLSDDGFYTSNELYKTIVYNENSEADPTKDNDHATITFTNLRGQVVLKRAYANSMVDGFMVDDVQHDTYNVYDAFDNLAFVLPPLVTDITTQLETLCYQYKYDNYNRLIEKKTPDKTNWEYIVYDRLNRIVETGPVASPFGDGAIGYMLTRYDNFNRVCYTGWYATGNSRATIQALYTSAITNVTKTLTDTTIDTKGVRYTSNNLPTGFKLLTVNYYDSYNFAGAPPTVAYTPTTDFPVYYNNSTKLPKGLPTGSWVRTLTTDINAVGETSYILYDYRARPISSKAVNYMGGITTTKNKLNFANQTLYTTTTHQRATLVNGTVSNAVTTRDTFTYTDQGRLDTHTKRINSEAIHVLSKPAYNELGQVVSKNVGGKENEPRLQKVDYTYNIRGWMTDINKITNLFNGNDPQDAFAFKINYELPDDIDKTLYNGNISEVYWRSKSDNIKRKYSFDYDNLNRLTNAVYGKPDAASPETNAYNESMSYDKNGNITNLLRNGGQDQPINQPVGIDDLLYKYDAQNNQLRGVHDNSNSLQGFRDKSGSSLNDIDYTYDDNGNMITDNNKGISLIKYNHLNLPTEIIFENNNSKKINYIYDASGDKLKKVVTEGPQVITTDYLDGFQYRNAVLQFFPHAEGYVVNTQTVAPSGVKIDNYNYVYNYLDHLGNVRLSYAWDYNLNVLKIIEENAYYPFGLRHSGYNGNLEAHKAVANETKVELKGIPSGGGETVGVNQNMYKFNGQEWQSELALNLYDMEMRDYDPAIARWLTLDPVIHFSQSPYNAFDNNPIYYADPSGADGEPINTWHYAGTSNYNAYSSVGAGHLGSGDHMFGTSGDAFWMGETAYTGGELSNGIKTLYGSDAVDALRAYSSKSYEVTVDSVEIVTDPSTDSFNFEQTSSNWQEAAVNNIHFRVYILNAKGVEINYYASFKTVLFGAPTRLKVGNTPIDAKTAAYLSTKALKSSMDETVSKFGGARTEGDIVERYFMERLKQNYPLFIPGGRVNFNAMYYTVTPTYYKTKWF